MAEKMVAYLLSCGHYGVIEERNARMGKLVVGDGVPCEICGRERPMVSKVPETSSTRWPSG